MSERKFQIVKEQLVGEIPEKLRSKWDQLVARRERIEKQEKALEFEMKKFYRRIEKELNIDEDGKAFRGVRLSNDGSVYEIYCECPDCQADLHGISVASMVEEMIRQDLIHPKEIGTVRQRASEIDSSKRTEEKKNLLYN